MHPRLARRGESIADSVYTRMKRMEMRYNPVTLVSDVTDYAYVNLCKNNKLYVIRDLKFILSHELVWLVVLRFPAVVQP